MDQSTQPLRSEIIALIVVHILLLRSINPDFIILNINVLFECKQVALRMINTCWLLKHYSVVL